MIRTKVIILFCLFSALSVTILAQKNEFQQAKIYENEGELDKAKTAIDRVVVHDETSGLATAWLYKGRIYQAIYESDNEEFKSLSDDALTQSMEAYARAISMDQSGQYRDDIRYRLKLIGSYFRKSGAQAIESNDYQSSLNSFENAVKAAGYGGQTDTVAMYYAALVSTQLGNNEKAFNYYKQLAEFGYKKPEVYSELSRIYLTKKDTENSLNIATQGESHFPEDLGIIKAHINYNLSTGNEEGARKYLEKAVALDPDDPELCFALGSIYDSRANPASGNRPEDYSSLTKNAESNYKAAISASPDHFKANFNLAALYYNMGADILNQAAAGAVTNEEYAKAKVDADNMFKSAIPYFEKVLEIKPNEMNSLNSLKDLYSRLGDADNFNRIKAKLDQIKENGG